MKYFTTLLVGSVLLSLGLVLEGCKSSQSQTYSEFHTTPRIAQNNRAQYTKQTLSLTQPPEPITMLSTGRKPYVQPLPPTNYIKWDTLFVNKYPIYTDIWVTTDMRTWNLLVTFTNKFGHVTYNAGVASNPRMFYRVSNRN